LNESSPLISVVIPTFNRGERIRVAIDSALNQTWPRLEIVVVDDCSSDDTWDVVQSYGNRIRPIRLSENRGGGYARNVGIDAAKGEFVAFLDCDDYWAPEKLAEQARLIPPDHDKMVIYNRVVQVVGERLVPTPLHAWTADIPIDEYIVVRKQSMQTSGLMIARKFAHDVRFDDSLRKHQDVDFVFSLANEGGKFIFCSAETVFYENTTLAGRVSTTPAPERTEILIAKWGAFLTPRTKAYYRAVTIAPMQLRVSVTRSTMTLVLSLPYALEFAKDVMEGFILWNTSEATYNKIRRLYGAIRRHRRTVQ